MGYQGIYDAKWDGQSTHQCSSWHQKQTTGRRHRFESHNSLGSESSLARRSPLCAFALQNEYFGDLTFHYRPAVWRVTVTTLMKGPFTLCTRSRVMTARSTGTKTWEQGNRVAWALYALFLQRRPKTPHESNLHARRLTTAGGEEQMLENTR